MESCEDGVENRQFLLAFISFLSHNSCCTYLCILQLPGSDDSRTNFRPDTHCSQPQPRSTGEVNEWRDSKNGVPYDN